MILINEKPILDLVGQGNYHSCFITTYSIDLGFFEQILLFKLRSKGIHNIHVIVDENMLDQSLNDSCYSYTSNKKKYSISTIKTDGAFHPKVFFFFGKEGGLLTVGSGNLTANGMGLNNEIWNSFHISDKNMITKSIFIRLWNHIIDKHDFKSDIVNLKLSWINKYSKWLEEAFVLKDTIQELDDQYHVGLLINDKTSIFSKIVNTVKEEIQEITVVSPFLDNDFRTLKRLMPVYKNAKISVIGNKDFSDFPLLDDQVLMSRIKCYHIENVVSNFHSKIIHFKGTSNSYIITGSANLTNAAMGTETSSARNIEASILLKSSSINWINVLGLDKNLIEFSPSSKDKLNHSSNQTIRHSFRLLYVVVTLKSIKIRITSNKEMGTYSLHLKLFDMYDKIQESFEIIGSNDKFDFEVIINHKGDEIQHCKYAQLFDDGERAKSNRQIISNLGSNIETNPSPEYRNIQILMSQIESGNKHLLDILQFLDVQRKNKPLSSSTGNRSVSKNKKNVDMDLTHYPTPALNINTLNMEDYAKYNTSINQVCDFLFNFKKFHIIGRDNTIVDEESGNDGTSSLSSQDYSSEITVRLKKVNKLRSYLKSYINDYRKQKKSDRNIKSLQEVGLFNSTMYLLLESTEMSLKVDKNDIEIKAIPLRSKENCGSIITLEDFYGLSLNIILYFTVSIKGFMDFDNDFIKSRMENLKEHTLLISMIGISILKYLMINDKAGFELKYIDSVTSAMFYLVLYKMKEGNVLTEESINKIGNHILNNLIHFSNQLDKETIVKTMVYEFNAFDMQSATLSKYNDYFNRIVKAIRLIR